MAFRKRNIGLSHKSELNPKASEEEFAAGLKPISFPGVRPSPKDGRPTTSTGTLSFDGILAGHAGLALGSSVLVEETGSTDYAGTLLRYFAAEGIVQGHKVHILGFGEQWGRELPGVVGPAGNHGEEQSMQKKGKMKIAWRYENLGDFASGRSIRGSIDPSATVEQQYNAAMSAEADRETAAFCHVFDLAKRLEIPAIPSINYIALPPSSPRSSPFTSALQSVSTHITGSPPSTIHRLIVPTILSPAIYPPHASEPQHLLQFMHGLRGLLRRHAHRLVAMLTLPLELHPRSSGLIRWMELLSDGVLELTPFPHVADAGPSANLSASGAVTNQEEPPQGMVRLHKLPVFHERGGGGVVAGLGDNLAFTVSRRKFVIKPLNLPPVDEDTEAQQGNAELGQQQPTKEQMDF